MPLKSTLDDIVVKLKERDFPDEAAISTGVVLRVLGELDWPVHEHRVVWPEYRTMNGRVDYALCVPHSRPTVFVEVKQHGLAEATTAIKQALRYASDEGVPFVVLTDGQTWSFFLPTERGSYEDRRVLKLDLCESSSQDSKDILVRYLEHGRVASGEALAAARNEYRDRERRETILRMLPRAWAALVRRPDDELVRLLSDAVELQAHVRPDDADVRAFLRCQSHPTAVPRLVQRTPRSSSLDSTDSGLPSMGSEPTVAPRENPHHTNASGTISRAGFVIIDGRRHEYTTYIEAMVSVLTALQHEDQSFCERLSKHPYIRRRVRTLVAKNAVDIFPNTPHLYPIVAHLPGGWLVSKDLDSGSIMKLIDVALEVSGKSIEWSPSVEVGAKK